MVAVVGLAVAFRRVDLDALGAALAEASWSWFAAAAAATILAVIVRAWRWRLLLAPVELIGVEPLFAATMIGYFGNGVLPLRLGELMRAVAVGRRGGRVDASTALGSIAVERLLDVVSALGVAALVVPFSGGFGGGIEAWAGAAVLVTAAFGGLLWASRSPRLRRSIAARAEASGGGRPGQLARSFLRGLLILGEGPKLLPIALQTVVIWAAYVVATWAAARAAGVPLSWLETGLVLVATTVAVSVPAAPGYVGTYHAAVVLVTADLLDHPVARAQAFAILSHASSWLPTVGIGAFYLLRSSIRLRDLDDLAPARPEDRTRP
jgi:glycosyltransferase 2 family protein